MCSLTFLCYDGTSHHPFIPEVDLLCRWLSKLVICHVIRIAIHCLVSSRTAKCSQTFLVHDIASHFSFTFEVVLVR